MAPTTEFAVEQTPQFQLTSDKSTYYQREWFSVHVFVDHTGSEEHLEEASCPILYLRQRSPDGKTRIDEVHPIAFKGCRSTVLGHQQDDWQSGFELDSGANSRWEGVGEHTFQVFQLAGSADDPQLRFVSSNVLRIQIADPSTLSRRWGSRVKGIAADISLDKDTYRLGEDIPLHLAIENFDADVPVYSGDPVWDPCAVIRIEVQNAAGRAIDETERTGDGVCTGHGAGLRLYAMGNVVSMEKSLRSERWLPNHPGTFTIVVTWAPCMGPTEDVSGPGIRAMPFKCSEDAIARASATIHIVGSDTPNSVK